MDMNIELTQSQFNVELIKQGKFVCRNSQFCLFSNIGKHNLMYGGDVMKELDMVCAVFASEICDTPLIVTKTMNVEFISPIEANDIYKTYVRLINIGKTSIELEAEIRTHSVDTEKETTSVRCKTIFVRINQKGEKLNISDHVRFKFGYPLINNYSI